MANVLWDQGEMTTSIRMLQQLNEQGDLQKQALVVSRAEVLASLVCLFALQDFLRCHMLRILILLLGTPRCRGALRKTRCNHSGISSPCSKGA